MANEYAVNSADLTAVADAIRAKGGTSGALAFPGGFVEALGAIEAGGGGDNTLLISVLEQQSLTEIDLPEGLEYLAIKPVPMSTLRRVGFPSTIRRIGSSVFDGSNLGITELPDCIEEIGQWSFQNCKMALTKLPDNLKKMNNNYQFKGCSNICITELPRGLTALNVGAFQNCTSIESLKVYETMTTLGTYTFNGCTALRMLDVLGSPKIDTAVLNGCSALKTLIIRGSTLSTMSNTNALSSTPIASGEGYIYVPSSLLDSYKAATNWSAYADQFRALEDYTVDGTITGELDESKI